MKRFARRVTPALLALIAGCAGPYDDPSTSTYVVGAIFLILGIIAGVALIMSLNEG